MAPTRRSMPLSAPVHRLAAAVRPYPPLYAAKPAAIAPAAARALACARACARVLCLHVRACAYTQMFACARMRGVCVCWNMPACLPALARAWARALQARPRCAASRRRSQSPALLRKGIPGPRARQPGPGSSVRARQRGVGFRGLCAGWVGGGVGRGGAAGGGTCLRRGCAGYRCRLWVLARGTSQSERGKDMPLTGGCQGGGGMLAGGRGHPGRSAPVKRSRARSAERLGQA